MSNFNLDSLKISLEYEGRKIVTEVPPYKLVKNIKDLSKKLFYIFEKEIELIYKNQIIEKKNFNKSLGEYFNNKNLINIKIIPKSAVVKNSKLRLASLKNNNKVSDTNISNLPKNYLCNECKKNVFAQFCRNCNLFLCNKCRISPKHENHKCLDINIERLEENIKYYSIIIQNEMKSNVLITKNYEKNFKKKNFIDFSSRHEIIQRKYNNLFDKYQEIINNLNIPENKNFDQMLKEYQNKSKNYYQLLEQITNDLKKNKKKENLNFNEFKKYFDEINKNEKKINKLSRNLVVYKINYEITEKLNKIYDDIEMILDMTLNSKIPFFIDQESFNMYQLILNEDNNENDDEEENFESQNENKLINSSSSKMKFKEKYIIDAKNKKNNENEEMKNNHFFLDEEDVEHDDLQKNFEQKMQNDYVNSNKYNNHNYNEEDFNNESEYHNGNNINISKNYNENNESNNDSYYENQRNEENENDLLHKNEILNKNKNNDNIEKISDDNNNYRENDMISNNNHNIQNDDLLDDELNHNENQNENNESEDNNNNNDNNSYEQNEE